MLFFCFFYKISIPLISTCEKNALYLWSNLVQLEKYYSPPPVNTLPWDEYLIQSDSNFFLNSFSLGTPLNANMSLIIIAGVERTP